MSETSVSPRGGLAGFVGRRSMALLEILRFLAWLARTFTRSVRGFAALAVILAAVAGIVVLCVVAPDFSALWVGLGVASLAGVFILLLISYLRLRIITGAQAERDQLIQSLHEAMRARLEETIAEQSRQTREAVGVMTDLVRTLEDGFGRRMDEQSHAFEAVLAPMQAEIGALADAQVTAGGGAVLADIDRRLESLADEQRRFTRDAVSDALDRLRVIEERASAEIAALSEDARRLSQRIDAVPAGLAASGPPPEALAALEQRQDALEARLADQVEAQLDAWRARLHNEINSAIAAGRESEERRAIEAEEALRAQVEMLAENVAAAGRSIEGDLVERVDDLDARFAEISGGVVGEEALAAGLKPLQDLREELSIARADAADRIRRVAETLVNHVDTVEGRLTRRLEQIAAERRDGPEGLARQVADLSGAVSAIGARAAEQVGAAESRFAARLAALDTRIAEAAKAAGEGAVRQALSANAAMARSHDRQLTPEALERLERHWLPVLGLSMPRSALAYLAMQVGLLEDRGQGRIAAPVETVLLRLLALRSIARGPVEVLEIGTLFGLGAATLHRLAGPRAGRVSLTLIDPMEGYHEAGIDPITGVAVTEPVLRDNMRALGVPDDDWRLIKRRSTEPKALNAARDRTYDYLLIDGDHSTAGVSSDFAAYAPLVKPGGLIVFDQYGSERWPGIQPFVDQTVRSDPDWTWIGGEFGTCVLSRRVGTAPGRPAA